MLAHALEDDGLGGARPGATSRRMEVGRHPRAGRRPAAARSGSIPAPATRSAALSPDRGRAAGFDGVLDGELLVVRDGEVALLQRPAAAPQPQGRDASVSWSAIPAYVRLYDSCCRRRGSAPAALRRAPARLEAFWHARAPPRMRPLAAHRRSPSGELQRAARRRRAPTGIEGLMLKRRDSAYVAGRPRGCGGSGSARADPRLRADVCPARPRQAVVFLLRLHLRRLARGRRRRRAGAGRQGLFRLHRRGAAAVDRWVRNHTT